MQNSTILKFKKKEKWLEFLNLPRIPKLALLNTFIYNAINNDEI